MKRPKYTPLDRECDACLKHRAGVALFILIVAFSSISARVFYLQMLRHDHWKEEVQTKRQRTEELPAARGAIFDAHQRLLASDEMVQAVVFDNIFLNEQKSKGALDRMAQSMAASEKRPWVDLRRGWSEAELQHRYIWWLCSLISPALEKTPEELEAAIKNRTNRQGVNLAWDRGETVLAKEINALQSGNLKKLMEEHPLSCLKINSFFRRSYPNERDLTHVIGLINANGPVCGVEYGRQQQLKGTPGFRTYEIDGGGREVTGFQGKLVEPVQGNSLRLTLDTTLQDIVEETLDEVGTDPNEVYVPELEASRAIVVLMDAKTLAIRAIAVRRAGHKEGTPLLVNPATEEIYEPGSTMKVVTIATALDSGKVNSNTLIPLHHGRYDDADIDPITDDEPFASLSVRHILVHSSNIGSYMLARTVGMKRFQESLRAFGFGDRTGMNCGRESAGIVQKEWTYNVLARSSFGYNVGVTPVQMCGALGVILNDGWYKQPYLVDAVLDAKNRVLEEHQSRTLRRVISPSAAKATRDAMLDVVEMGTGTKAQSQDYYIAGKTGTSRKAGAGGYIDGEYVVSFLGFAPVQNPKLIGVVVLDAPKGTKQSLYGGKLAAPVFRRVMERALRYYSVPPEAVAHTAKPLRR
jgi:cell division protein FtsI/penicillin-binding protein 2